MYRTRRERGRGVGFEPRGSSRCHDAPALAAPDPVNVFCKRSPCRRSVQPPDHAPCMLNSCAVRCATAITPWRLARVVMNRCPLHVYTCHKHWHTAYGQREAGIASSWVMLGTKRMRNQWVFPLPFFLAGCVSAWARAKNRRSRTLRRAHVLIRPPTSRHCSCGLSRVRQTTRSGHHPQPRGGLTAVLTGAESRQAAAVVGRQASSCSRGSSLVRRGVSPQHGGGAQRVRAGVRGEPARPDRERPPHHRHAQGPGI